MSLTSKRNIISIVAGVALIIAYAVFALGANAPGAGDIRAWAAAILIFIGIGIVVQIIMQIVFHIAVAIGIAVKEGAKACAEDDSGAAVERIVEADMVEDERSKLINLKASRLGSWFLASGVVAAIALLAAGAATVISLHILFGMSALASVAEGIAGIVYHERGVKY